MIRKPTAADREKYIEIAGEFYATDAVLRPVPRAYLERTFDEMLSSDCYAEGYLFEQKGEILSGEDGTVYTPEMVLGPARRGIKMTYCLSLIHL